MPKQGVTSGFRRRLSILELHHLVLTLLWIKASTSSSLGPLPTLENGDGNVTQQKRRVQHPTFTSQLSPTNSGDWDIPFHL